MRRLDAQLRDTRKKPAAAVRASGTTLTEVLGVGPVIAGTIIGDIADVSRFPGRDRVVTEFLMGRMLSNVVSSAPALPGRRQAGVDDASHGVSRVLGHSCSPFHDCWLAGRRRGTPAGSEASVTVTCADGIRYGGHYRLAASGRAIIGSRSSTDGNETQLLGGR
jgi:hypothetical protein